MILSTLLGLPATDLNPLETCWEKAEVLWNLQGDATISDGFLTSTRSNSTAEEGEYDNFEHSHPATH